jgi:membrane protein involved in colicin uptake
MILIMSSGFELRIISLISVCRLHEKDSEGKVFCPPAHTAEREAREAREAAAAKKIAEEEAKKKAEEEAKKKAEEEAKNNITNRTDQGSISTRRSDVATRKSDDR